MGISLYSLIESALLCLNAICVLHEERFLAKFGWGANQRGFEDKPGPKYQILNLIRSIRTVMRIPLIAVNVFVIIFKLAAG